jgi:putative endonuclease
MPDPRRAVGQNGEDAAAAWYADAGYDILVRNSGTIAFCEVKTRRGDAFGLPAEAVTMRKQLRIRKLAGRWLGEHDATAENLRFDVAAVLPNGRGGWEVDVFTNAF